MLVPMQSFREQLALSANYTITYVGANLTITTRAITITADPKTKVYGTADPALTYQITSGSLAGNGDAFTGALTRDPGQNIGTYAIRQGTLALNSNYTLTIYRSKPYNHHQGYNRHCKCSDKGLWHMLILL